MGKSHSNVDNKLIKNISDNKGYKMKLDPLFSFLLFINNVWLLSFTKSNSFSADLSFLACVVFMVAVNFSSLIPAAPGGIGVIEAVATAVLVGIGIEKELALSMVITQHAIQFMMIAIPGLIIFLSLYNFAGFARCPRKQSARTCVHVHGMAA